jgi:hypothetical protein
VAPMTELMLESIPALKSLHLRGNVVLNMSSGLEVHPQFELLDVVTVDY